MQVHFWDDQQNAGLQVRQHNTFLNARRDGEKISVTLQSATSAGKCGGVEATITVCFTCAEFERLLCELGRIECGASWCAPCGPFDQDECDEREREEHSRKEDECEEGTVIVNVGELRSQLKGLRADETVRIRA